MGQAKHRRERLRQDALVDIEKWLSPTSEGEKSLAIEIAALPVLNVPREDRAKLDWMRMKPQQCHVNCTSYVRLDPEERSSAVHGWWKRRDTAYVCHSVVQRNGLMICITPYALEENELEFIPDTKIVPFVGSDGSSGFIRNGAPFPHIVRRNYESVIAQSSWIKRRLLSGMDPYQAGDLSTYKGIM